MSCTLSAYSLFPIAFPPKLFRLRPVGRRDHRRACNAATDCIIVFLTDLFGSPMHVGTTCRPYPEFRLPGWNRLSAGLHLDDMQKFWEDPCGGRSYDKRLTTVVEGDVIGCGYDFSSRALFYTVTILVYISSYCWPQMNAFLIAQWRTARRCLSGSLHPAQ